MSRNDKVVNIVLTNGDKAYKFLWVKQTVKGIYYGFHDKTKDGFHESYHIDGRRHTVHKGEKERIFYSTPLSEIKSIRNIVTISPGPFETTNHLSIPYNNAPLGHLVWIDMRSFPKDSCVNIHVSLVKPEKLADLSGGFFNKKERDDYHLIQIINAFDPWLVIHAHGCKNTNN